MITISLASYTFKVRKKREKECFKLDNVKNHHFKDLINEFLSGIKEFWHDDTKLQQTIQLSNKLEEPRLTDNLVNGFRISGAIDFGEYGIKAPLRDRRTRQIVHHRTQEHIQSVQMHFLIYVPNNSTTGVIILQRFKNEGIKVLFEKALKNFLEIKDSELIVELFDVVPTALIRYLENPDCQINRIKLISTSYNRTEEAYEVGRGTEERMYDYELSIIARKKDEGGFLKRMLGHLRRAGTLSGEAEYMQIAAFGAEKALVTINTGKRERTFQVDRPDTAKPYTDITSEVAIIEGEVRQSDVAREAHDLLEDIIEQLVLA